MATILIVDDDTAVVPDWVDMLTEDGYDAVGGKNGQEGLDLLTENTKIVFLDFQMPGVNGYEFSRIVKTDTKYANYRDIILVGTGGFLVDN